MYKNTNYGSSNNKWIAIDSAKKWVERILQYNKERQAASVSHNASKRKDIGYAS